jgi:hypothetical protein
MAPSMMSTARAGSGFAVLFSAYSYHAGQPARPAVAPFMPAGWIWCVARYRLTPVLLCIEGLLTLALDEVALSAGRQKGR